MNKNEYLEFTNLQEHYEWLHSAEDRAKTKLETFTTDDSEFDELVREAVKVYFETEIDKAWKKIEEFKTAPTFVADREDAIRYCSKKNDLPKDKTYYEFDFGTWSITIDSDVFDEAHNDCYTTDKDCNECAINDIMDLIPFICGHLEEKYLRGEYYICHGKGEA